MKVVALVLALFLLLGSLYAFYWLCVTGHGWLAVALFFAKFGLNLIEGPTR